MSIMTRGIISQPYNLAMHSGLSRRQFYSHAQVLLADHDSAHKHWQNEANNVQALVAEVGRLKADNVVLRNRADRWEEVGRLILSEMPLRLRPRVAGNAPGHCHEVPGVWDTDNGELAGRECAWCKVWATALELSKGPAHE